MHFRPPFSSTLKLQDSLLKKPGCIFLSKLRSSNGCPNKPSE